MPVAKPVLQLFQVLEKEANCARILQYAQPRLRVDIASDAAPELIHAVAGFFAKYRSSMQHALKNTRGKVSGGVVNLVNDDEDDDAEESGENQILSLAAGTKPATVTRRLGQALLCTPAQPMAHQRHAMDIWKSEPHQSHILLNFSMGSGKSLAALFMIAAAADKPHYRVLIICSNTMIGHWMSEIRRVPLRVHNSALATVEYTIVGYTEFRRMVTEANAASHPGFVGKKYDTVVVDEAHYFRNLTPAMLIDVDALRRAKRTILVTGTPLQNDIGEVHGMLYLLGLRGNESLKEAERLLVQRNAMFYYNPSLHGSAATKLAYPQIRVVEERVPMCVEQTVEYCFSQNRATEFGPHSIETARCNSYNSLTRAVSNSYSDTAISPKFERVLANVQSGRFSRPHVVYSHYRGKGVEQISRELARRAPDLRVVLMTGSTAARERDKLIADYNAGKVDVFFITDAAREGIDLHGTGTMHLMEPHENIFSEYQTRARVARHNSHSHLEPEQRFVTIVKYISTFPRLVPKDAAAIRNYLKTQFDFAPDDCNCVDALQTLLKKNKNETVDEEYERRNVGKAGQLQPWIEMFERIGQRQFQQNDAAIAQPKKKKAVKKAADTTTVSAVAVGAAAATAPLVDSSRVCAKKPKMTKKRSAGLVAAQPAAKKGRKK